MLAAHLRYILGGYVVLNVVLVVAHTNHFGLVILIKFVIMISLIRRRVRYVLIDVQQGLQFQLVISGLIVDL